MAIDNRAHRRMHDRADELAPCHGSGSKCSHRTCEHRHPDREQPRERLQPPEAAIAGSTAHHQLTLARHDTSAPGLHEPLMKEAQRCTF